MELAPNVASSVIKDSVWWDHHNQSATVLEIMITSHLFASHSRAPHVYSHSHTKVLSTQHVLLKMPGTLGVHMTSFTNQEDGHIVMLQQVRKHLINMHSIIWIPKRH